MFRIALRAFAQLTLGALGMTYAYGAAAQPPGVSEDAHNTPPALTELAIESPSLASQSLESLGVEPVLFDAKNLPPALRSVLSRDWHIALSGQTFEGAPSVQTWLITDPSRQHAKPHIVYTFGDKGQYIMMGDILRSESGRSGVYENLTRNEAKIRQ